MYQAPGPLTGTDSLQFETVPAATMSFTPSSVSFPERLDTFRGFWDDNEPTARQLAAIGHVCDRPPLEALEEGSHCLDCGIFVRRGDSIKALEGPPTEAITLHHPHCIRLQVRIPLETYSDLHYVLGSPSVSDIRTMWERRSKLTSRHRTGERQVQSSSLFSLPTEIRLQIYSMILPSMDKVTPITQLNQDSWRVITQMGFEKTGPRDMTRINLLCTCRAVHGEALDILFASTTYKFDSTKLLYLFLRHIGHHGRQLLKSVDVTCNHREDAVAFSLLASCPKLRNITLRLRRPSLLKPPLPIWIIDGVACLLELSGLDNVIFGETQFPGYLDETKQDAAIVRRELTRPRGEKSGIRWINGYPDL